MVYEKETESERDARIISLFGERNEEALAEVERFFGRLCRSVAGNIIGGDAADECVNDAMLKLWNAIPPAKPHSLRSYAVMLTRSIAINRYHAEKAAKRGGGNTVALDELGDALYSSVGSEPEEEAGASELSRAINEFLASQSPLDRSIFVRRYWFCDSIETISALTGLSGGNISVKLHRLRSRLKKSLEGSKLL